MLIVPEISSQIVVDLAGEAAAGEGKAAGAHTEARRHFAVFTSTWRGFLGEMAARQTGAGGRADQSSQTNQKGLILGAENAWHAMGRDENLVSSSSGGADAAHGLLEE